MIVSLVGCGPQYNDQYLFKDKPVTKDQKARDQVACMTKVNKEIPTNNQIGTTPSFTVPVSCNTTGSLYGYSYSGTTNCSGGQTYGGQAYSYDANADLKQLVFEQCMVDKGYSKTPYPIKLCKPEQVPAGFVKPNSKIYKPEPNSCVINAKISYEGSVLLRPQDQVVPNKN